MIKVDTLDHLVLTVADIQATCDFYTRTLGMDIVTFSGGRTALAFGNQKINLHQAGQEFEPKAAWPTPGSSDLCFVSQVPLAEIIKHLQLCEAAVVEGPVERSGATGPIESVYLRDPDGNLVEIANYVSAS